MLTKTCIFLLFRVVILICFKQMYTTTRPDATSDELQADVFFVFIDFSSLLDMQERQSERKKR